MDRIKGQLTEMFDEMRGQLGEFRRKTYATVFKAAFEKYKDLLAEIEALCGEGSKEEQEQTVLEIASVIPDHGREEAEKMRQLRKGKETVDLNMTMAVYIVPLFMYVRTENCEKVGEAMVKLWNKRGITPLRLGSSTFETIESGFADTILGIRLKR